MDIIRAVKKLAEYLNTRFSEDKFYLQYKSTLQPNEFEVCTPTIYTFTAPSSELVDGYYPAKCPCVVLTLDAREDYNYTLTANLCISNVSTSEREMAHKLADNLYKIGEGENYTTEADLDLVMLSIMFTDQVYNYMKQYKELNVSNVLVNYPEVSLPDFPYAISSVTFQISINISEVGQIAFHDYY